MIRYVFTAMLSLLFSMQVLADPLGKCVQPVLHGITEEKDKVVDICVLEGNIVQFVTTDALNNTIVNIVEVPAGTVSYSVDDSDYTLVKTLTIPVNNESYVVSYKKDKNDVDQDRYVVKHYKGDKFVGWVELETLSTTATLSTRLLEFGIQRNR